MGIEYDSMDFSGSDDDVQYQMREIERAMREFRGLQKAGESLLECEECGDDIPAARREAIRGCTTCIHCQELIERGLL